MTNKKMKPKYWEIEKVTGDWEVDIALERCERTGFFQLGKAIAALQAKEVLALISTPIKKNKK